jgi:hypothetical protein
MTPQQEERAAGLAAEHLGPAAGVYFDPTSATNWT